MPIILPPADKHAGMSSQSIVLYMHTQGFTYFKVNYRILHLKYSSLIICLICNSILLMRCKTEIKKNHIVISHIILLCG